MRTRFIALSLLSLALAGPAAAADHTPPPAYNAKTYPAVEVHGDEKVAVAVDVFDAPEKNKFFRLPYYENGILPVRLIVTNDGDQPLSLADARIEFETAGGEKIRPATEADIDRRFAHPARPDRQQPLPLPRMGKPKSADKNVREDLDALGFKALAVEPHGTQSGFFFFDIEGLEHPLQGAHLYVTGLKDARGQDLFFFEVPFERYLREPVQ